ncbi:MAG: sigma-70 family RNA polymerase sigma factor [Bryobacterales bacterium]|nr:sigma-70 family RNA polymerase sigma factor [Bryobacterales bacterium]
MSGPRAKWNLDQQALAALLEAAGSADHYEELRQRLIRFFRWERCADPEHCADETFNRVAKRLREGERVERLDAYVHGVARFLVKEDQGQRKLRERALIELPVKQASNELTPELDCLEKCMAELPADQQRFILRYYQGEEAVKIRNRKAMASELGIQLNALRNRALRLRERLEACLQGCLASRPS